MCRMQQVDAGTDMFYAKLAMALVCFWHIFYAIASLAG